MKRLTSVLALSCVLAGCGKSSTDSRPVTERPSAPAVPAQPTSGEPAPDREAAFAAAMSTARQAIEQHDGDTAVRALSRAISLKPGASEPFVLRAAILAEANLLAQAIVDMSAAIGLDPGNPKLHNTRGYFLLLRQEHDRADQDFSDAIGLDLNYPQPYNNRGLTNIARGKFDEAIKDFDNAIRVKSDYVDAHNNRGFALMQLERFDEAIAAFTTALECNPSYINAVTNRARAYSLLKNQEQAVADYTRAIELSPETLQLYLLRAAEYRLLGREQDAHADVAHVEWVTTLVALDQRVRKHPSNSDAWVAKGRHFLTRQKTDQARECFDNALRLDPQSAPAHIGKAAAELQAKNFESTVRECDLALARDVYPEAHSLRADACLELGRLDEAIAGYEAARRFDSQVVRAYRERAAAKRAAGDETQASSDEQLANILEQRLNGQLAADPGEAPRAMVLPVSFEQANNTSSPERN